MYLEEKVSSTNKRLDDVLIFGGIIITLLLAINIGVAINSEKQFAKYMNDNFNIYKDKIQKHLIEVEATAGRIKTELELVQKLRRNTESIQIPNNDEHR